jgi:hypothetical protein
MELDSILLSDKRAALLVVKALDQAVRKAAALVDSAKEGHGPVDEYIRFEQTVGKFISTSLRVELTIVRHSVDKTQLPSRCEVQKLSDSMSIWQSRLDSKDINSLQVTMAIGASSICSNRDLAKVILRGCDRIEELVARSNTAVQSSNCMDEEKYRYLQVYGLLHSVCAATPLLIYLQHDDLIPDDDWRETVEYNRGLLANH